MSINSRQRPLSSSFSSLINLQCFQEATISLGMAVHTFNPSLERQRNWISMSSRLAWSSSEFQDSRATEKNPVSKRERWGKGWGYDFEARVANECRSVHFCKYWAMAQTAFVRVYSLANFKNTKLPNRPKYKWPTVTRLSTGNPSSSSRSATCFQLSAQARYED